MFRWLAPVSERRLLSGDRQHGPTTYLIAIMTFAMVLVAAAGLALASTAEVVARGIAHRYAVQLPSGDGVPRVLAAARGLSGVSNVQAVPESEIRDTLERWLGPAGLGADLPVPGLVTFDLSPGIDAAAISRRIQAAASGARVVAHEATLQPMLRSLRVLQWLALALVLMMAGATAAAVVLAARGALDTHRFTIDVMHGIGATDEQVTRLFQRSIALDALKGALAGGAAAAIVLLLLANGGTAAGELTAGPVLDTADLILLAILPLAGVLLAMWVARMAVLAALRRSL